MTNKYYRNKEETYHTKYFTIINPFICLNAKCNRDLNVALGKEERWLFSGHFWSFFKWVIFWNIYMVYNIGLQRYRDWKIRICVKDNFQYSTKKYSLHILPWKKILLKTKKKRHYENHAYNICTRLNTFQYPKFSIL